MSVAVTIDIPTGTEEKYEKVVADLYPGGKLPDGWLLHMAGPIEGGWRVVNVVPSQEEFEVFAREQLLPATQGVGDPPPQVTYFPVYRLIEAPNDGA